MADKGKGKAIAIAALVGLGLLLIGRKGKASTKAADMTIGKYFKLSEFLRSRVFPDLAFYKPTAIEFANLTSLVKSVLDPMREHFGPILVTDGGRPAKVASAHGTTWYQALTEAGYFPAKVSDHDDFSAADVVPRNAAGYGQWIDVFLDTQKNPYVRQVILSAHTNHNTNHAEIDHIHVAVVTPTKPRKIGKDFAFLELDGKVVESFPENLIA